MGEGVNKDLVEESILDIKYLDEEVQRLII